MKGKPDLKRKYIIFENVVTPDGSIEEKVVKRFRNAREAMDFMEGSMFDVGHGNWTLEYRDGDEVSVYDELSSTWVDKENKDD